MNLDKYQKEAAFTEENNVLVVAAPGSGKTTVIVNRVRHLIFDREIPNRNIIVLTFTKAAAENMKKRFGEEMAPFFGTFHSLFYKILRREGYEVKIVDSSIVFRIVEKIFGKYFDEINEEKVKEIINTISLFKTSNCSMDEFPSPINKNLLKEVMEEYTSYLEKSGEMDFDDLGIKVLSLFYNNERKLNEYRSIFRNILVDEFQDCDEIQVEFLRLINNEGENSVFAVGDEDQCIYSFRGSKPHYMICFKDIFKNGVKYFLSINYRSGYKIVDASKELIRFNKERNEKEIYPFRKDEGNVVVKYLLSEEEQREEVSKSIRNGINLGERYSDFVVLYRTNKEAITVIDQLIKDKIPFNLLDGSYNFYEHFVCKNVISYLKLALDVYDKESFLSIINKPYRYVAKSTLASVRKQKEYIDPFEVVISMSDVPDFQKKKLGELKKEVAYLSKISLSSAIQYIVSDLEYIDYLREYAQKFGGRVEDYEGVLEELKISAAPFRTIREFLLHVEEVKEKIAESKNDKNENRVNLATIHRVKGMEFKNVILINCIEGNIPYIGEDDTNIEEERRIFYVGLTRAKDNAIIISPRKKENKIKEESRFIKEGKIVEEVKILDVKVGDKINIKGTGQGKIIDVKGETIKVKFTNGEEKSFSYPILNQNGLVIKV